MKTSGSESTTVVLANIHGSIKLLESYVKALRSEFAVFAGKKSMDSDENLLTFKLMKRQIS